MAEIRETINGLQAYNKAIAAFLVGVVVLVAGHFGFALPTDVQVALTTLVTAVIVWAVPNR